MIELRHQALQCLAISSPDEKLYAVDQLVKAYKNKSIPLDCSVEISNAHSAIPGRPNKPILVPPLDVKKRAMHTKEGRATLIHALAHIEFNAINLALDAIWRFAEMPTEYYEDWLKIAHEESYHFQLLVDRLESLGYEYGSFSGHNSLWEMVEKTSNDVFARMALVPRTMEARGLDAVPAIRQRFLQVKDQQVVDILDIILRDEIGHVAIGNRWFHYLCRLRELDPITAFQKLAKTYNAPTLRGPFNIEARKQAGFTEAELTEILGING